MPGSTWDTWRFRLLGLSLVALLAGHDVFGDLVMVAVGIVFVGALLFASAPRHVSIVPVLLAVPIVFAILFLGESATATAGSWYHIPLLLGAAWAVAQRVTHAERVNEDVVFGSVCVYALVAIAFAALYQGLERAVPGSFRGLGEAPAFGRYLYFSFVTITTLGYGDITPALGAAQSLVSLESVIGILYPAVVVARIVELATTGRSQPFAPAPAGERFGGRYRLLALVLVLALLSTPWVVDSPAGRFGLSALLGVQLLGALYATGVRGLVAGVAAVSGAIAVIAGVWPGEADAARWLALVARAVFFLLATAAVVRWLARERNVTREVLFASLAAYLLLGLCLSAAFQLVEAADPGAISFPDGTAADRSQILYYAFMTLTTTGFGEIAPASPIAGTLAQAGSLVGIFYPALLLARLVSLYGLEEESQ